MAVETRPDPDELLAHVKAEEARARRGRLRIFFGATAGVGKTYAMLERRAARAKPAAARSSSATSSRTAAPRPKGSLEGLERLPTLPVALPRHRAPGVRPRRGARAPARTFCWSTSSRTRTWSAASRAPRHPKRWQDIEELLDAGIDVWTTLNVQHLESLNDLVAQITGVKQRETVPDRVFDEADEVELIDLPPDDLLARLHAGKVYVPAEVGTAVERFFRKPNLIALRELALRRMTRSRRSRGARVARRRSHLARMARAGSLARRDRPGCAGRAARARRQAARRRAAREVDRRLRRDAGAAAALGAGAQSPHRFAAARRVARRRDGDARRADRRRGAHRVRADAPAPRASSSARRSGAAGVRCGAARRPPQLLLGAQRLRRRHGRGRPARPVAASGQPLGTPAEYSPALRWKRYLAAAAISAACTAVAFGMFPYLELSNLVMVYLLGVVVAGLRIGRLPSVLTAVLNVLCFDFFFVPPRLHVRGLGRAVPADVRRDADGRARHRDADGERAPADARRRCARAAHGAAVCDEPRARRDARHRRAWRGSRSSTSPRCSSASASCCCPTRPAGCAIPRNAPMDGSYRGADLAVAQWVADHGRRAGLGSDTLPASPALYLPLGEGRARRRRAGRAAAQSAARAAAGAAAPARDVRGPDRLGARARGSRRDGGRRACRGRARDAAQHACWPRSRTTCARRSRRWPAPRRRSSRAAAALDEAKRIELAQSIESKARDMSELVSKVLDLMRFDSGELALRRDWESLEDLVDRGARAQRGASRGSPRRDRAAGRSAARVGRRDARRAGVHEPVRQRREVHAAGHQDRRDGARREAARSA